MTSQTLPDLSDNLIREHAYLVSRGVRPLAIVGHCSDDPLAMLRTATKIEALACEGAIPFVSDAHDGIVDFGYAASRRVIDLFCWLRSANEEAVPEEHRDRILGVLLGYGVDAVRWLAPRSSGRRFAPWTTTPGSASS